MHCTVHDIANAIGMQFIVFTAQESYPMIHIPPREVHQFTLHSQTQGLGTMMF